MNPEMPRINPHQESQQYLVDNLTERIKNFLNGLQNIYREYIDCLSQPFKDVIKGFIELFNEAAVVQLVNFNEVSKVIGEQPPLEIKSAEAFLEIKEEIESFLRLMLAELLLSDEEILKDEKKKSKVEEFINKELSISDLTRLLSVCRHQNQPGFVFDFKFLNGEEIKKVLEAYRIQEIWVRILMGSLIRRIKAKENLEQHLRILTGIYKKNLGVLRESLKSLGLPQEEIEKIIERLKGVGTDESFLLRLSPKEMDGMLEFLKTLSEELDREKKEGEEDKKEIDWKKAKESVANIITILGGLGASGFLLWFALFGFFLPLGLIEKIRPIVEKALK